MDVVLKVKQTNGYIFEKLYLISIKYLKSCTDIDYGKMDL